MKALYTSKAGRTAEYNIISIFNKLGTDFVHLVSLDKSFDFKVPKNAVKIIGEEPKKQLFHVEQKSTPTPTISNFKTKPNIKLFEHQKIGVSLLMSKQRFLLNDDMGLGKTLQAIVAADNTLSDHVIVVCPASLVKNWEKEVAKFSLREKKFYVYSYGKIPNTISKDAILIVDESHYIKTPTSQRTKKIVELAKMANRVWLLTGTLLTKNVLDAYVPLSLLTNNDVSKSGYWSFAYKFSQVKKTRFGTKAEGVNEYNLPTLKKMMSEVVLTRKKHEVLDLPEKIRTTIPIKVSKTLAQESADLFDRYNSGESLSTDMSSGQVFGTVRRELGIAKVEQGLEYLKEQFQDSEESIVIFAYHRDVVSAIEKYLGDDCRTITGDTSLSKRQEYVEQFQAGIYRYIVLNIIAGGTGLTLTKASHAVFFEVDVTPANNFQAEDRIHRIGQTGTCNIHYLCAENSLDDRVFELLDKKTNDINKVMS